MNRNGRPLVPIPRIDLRILLEAGYLCLHMSRAREAQEIFDGVIPVAPRSELPHVALGVLHQAQGDAAESERCFRTAVERDPGSAFAWASYGEFLLAQGRKAEASAALTRATDLAHGGPVHRLVSSLREADHEPGH
jgi:Tfp pilus assembly protein PilF